MEVAAGYAEHADVQAGRLLDEIERSGWPRTRWSSTSGATTAPRARARTARSASCWPRTASRPRSTRTSRRWTRWAGSTCWARPKVDNQYHAGWAWAGSTPYSGMKLLASDLGGTRNPLAIRWPAKITADATPRAQFHHCQRRRPDDLRDRRDRSAARRQRRPAGSRLTASASPTRSMTPTRPAGSQRSTSRSWAAARSTTTAGWRRRPGRVCRGFPACRRDQGLDARSGRVAPVQPRAGLVASQRPRCGDAREGRADEGDVLDRGRTQQRLPDRRRAVDPVLPPRAADLHALSRMEFRARHRQDARVLCAGARQPRQPRDDRRRSSRERELACSTRSGARSGGLTCYVDDGYLCYEYNLFIIMRTKIRSAQPLPAGKAKIEISTEYAEVKPAGPLNIAMTVNGDQVAAGVVPVSAPLLFTANDCLDIGTCLGGPDLTGLLRPRAVPVQRHDRRRERPLHLLSSALGRRTLASVNWPDGPVFRNDARGERRSRRHSDSFDSMRSRRVPRLLS